MSFKLSSVDLALLSLLTGLAAFGENEDFDLGRDDLTPDFDAGEGFDFGGENDDVDLSSLEAGIGDLL